MVRKSLSGLLLLKTDPAEYLIPKVPTHAQQIAKDFISFFAKELLISDIVLSLMISNSTLNETLKYVHVKIFFKS